MIESIPIQLESRFVVVEGPVGSGKTSLAKRISEHVNGKLILEEPESCLPRRAQVGGSVRADTYVDFMSPST